MIRIRCSSISSIMTDPKSGDGLSVGAKTYLNEMAREFAYNFVEIISGKEFEKGIACEYDLIELYNNVFFTNYKKNTERKNNDWLTGEADIVVPNVKIVDMKNAFSLATFPSTEEDVIATCKKAGYDYQMRGYMALWDLPMAEVAYGVVSTPEDLMKSWYQLDLHSVDHIPPAMRITRTFFERDFAIEEKIKHKVELAREYLQNRVAQISLDHKH